MSDNEIRIAIAEACKWTISGETNSSEFHSIQGFPKGGNLTDKQVEIPDYPNDLNAMHEAEGSLDGTTRTAYLYQLAQVTGDDGFEFSDRSVCATARQRG